LLSISSYVKIASVRKLSRITPATLDVLEMLIDAREDLHGFRVASEAQRSTGSVYLMLNRLEDAGWVES
jgi:PadR family transcriptional regulator PadR